MAYPGDCARLHGKESIRIRIVDKIYQIEEINDKISPRQNNGRAVFYWLLLSGGNMSQTLSISNIDPIIHRTISVLDHLFPQPRVFNIRLWNGTELPSNSGASFTLVINRPATVRRMLTPPVELSLGESYIRGDFDIEGDIFSVLSLVDTISTRAFSINEIARLVTDVLALPADNLKSRIERGPAHLSGEQHSRERDLAAIQYHYDVGNDFYSLWLDRNLQYSCAYFPTGREDLDTAQEKKMEHICRKLRLKPGERLLDIGCGWGGLAIYAAKKYDVSVLGVTLSKNQALFARDWIAQSQLERVKIELQDYRDLGSETFDKLVSVGMFEHVGRSHLPEYFAQAYRLLKPGGLFLNHGISSRAPVVYDANRIQLVPDHFRQTERTAIWQKIVERYILGTGMFMQRYIFPDGELVPVSEANLIAEDAGFEVRDVENLREHYALTLRQWVNRLEDHQKEAIEAANEAVYRTWRIYMSGCVYGFETGTIGVNQSLLTKPENGKTSLPLSRADLYE
jgi:cyclopropane-fatty-acyl-phospholipid synthase